MDNPTRETMCADLARAMGWATSDGGNGRRWLSPDTSLPDRWMWYAPNPFDSADDSRALVAWLAADMLATKNMNRVYKFCELLAGGILGNDRLEVCDWEDCVIAALTAPLPVIAEAAWRAIRTTTAANAPVGTCAA